MNMEPEIRVVDGSAVEPTEVTLFGSSDPDVIVARATAQAKALADVIRKRGLFKKIGPKEHVFVEGWTLCGSMLGVFPVCVWTRPMEGNEGNILGWEARVEARTIQGHIVGAAEAQCMYAERNWASRDDFALRSMAQTRATSKALRMPLGFVVTLAGYSATPAEEMAVEPSPEPQEEGSPLYPPPDLEPALKASLEQVKAKNGETYALGECKCGSALVRKENKTGRPYITCDLTARAFRREHGMEALLAKINEDKGLTEKDHIWKWVKP